MGKKLFYLLPIAILLAIAGALLYGLDPAGKAGAPLPRDTVEIISGPNTHVFDIELADTPEATARGLMHRKKLAEKSGMLFDFGTPHPISMWMKNTYIPLDMLFISSRGTVVNIAQNTVPLSLDSIPSAAPVRAVLEINGGLATRLGIRPGDTVRHALFENVGASNE